MKAYFVRRFASVLAALVLTSGIAPAQSGVTLAIGGASCLCYLPTVLARQLGEFKKAGVEVEIAKYKGGSEALKALLDGRADVVSGYFDHCVNLAASGRHVQAFVTYDRFPGIVLVVSPKHAGEISSISDLAGRKVGVSAPGSSTDFFLRYVLGKNKVDPDSVRVTGVGVGARAIAAMEEGSVDAAIMVDPAVTVLANKYKDLKILSDTRSEKDTLAVFGGRYPGGTLYTRADWISAHPKETQAMTNAIVSTLRWIHSHSAEEIAARMPPEFTKDMELYVAALKNSMSMYSDTGRMDPRGAAAVLAVFARSSPAVAKADIDLSKTYTNKFVDEANRMMK